MNPTTHRKLNIVAATGLAIGAVFGLAGTIVTHSHLQATLWAIDSVGLVMATTLLTVKFLRKGCDVIAAGFLVFAIGEGVILSGTAAGLVGSIPSFAAGIALWAAGAFAHQYSQRVLHVGSCDRNCDGNSFCRHERKNVLGGAVASDFITVAIFRISVSCHNHRRLDYLSLKRTRSDDMT